MQKIITKIFAKSIGLYINILSYVNPSKSLTLSYTLFSRPRKGKLNINNLPKTLQKSELTTHHFENHQFQTYTWTQGKTKQSDNTVILLVHGWESNSSRWKKLLKHLISTDKTIIAIDAPAHGLSSGKGFNVPTYAEFINVIVQKYNPSTVIGHSLGGQTIAYFQQKFDHNFKKIILLGAPSDFKVILKNYKSLLGLNEKVYQQLVNYSKKRFDIVVDEFSGANFLKNTTIQGIIAHDIDDKVVLIDEANKITNSWKTAQFIQTKGLGHSLHDDDLYKTITAFIDSK